MTPPARRRKILVLSLSSTQFGGGEVWLLHVLRHLRDKHDLFVACARENKRMIERVDALGIPFIELPLGYRHVPSGVSRLARWHALEGFDLVYANGRRSQLFGALLAHRADLPVVGGDLLLNLPWSGGLGAIARNLLATAINRLVAVPRMTTIITICEFVRQELVGPLRVAPDKVVTIVNAVDAHHFAPQPRDESLARGLGIPSGAPVVCCSARLVPHKGQEVLIDAVEMLRRSPGGPDAWVVLIGDGPDEARLRRKIAATGASDRYRIIDFPADIRPYYALADVVVLASREEGMPTALLQAMAMERPVVGTEAQGIPEAIRHGENGFLFPMDETPALAARIGEVLADPTRAAEMGRAGRRRVLADFRLDTMLARIEEVFERARAKPRRHRR